MNETDLTPLRLQPGQMAIARVNYDHEGNPVVEFTARYGDIQTTTTVSPATAKELLAALNLALTEATGLPEPSDEVRELVRTGRKINAIETYRIQEDTRSPEEIAAAGPLPLIGLREAKYVIDELEVQMHKAGKLTYVPQHLSR